MRRKTPTTCYLRPDQLAALRQLNQDTRVPIAVLIRQGIDMVLEERLDERTREYYVEKYPPDSPDDTETAA